MKRNLYLITRHAIINYGSFLQTYASQNFFSKNGYDSRVIDYQNKFESVSNKVLADFQRDHNNKIFKKMHRFIYFILHYFPEKIPVLYFNKLRKKYLKLTDKYNNFKELVDSFGTSNYIFCSGSDQLWGPMPNGQIDKSYFLEFTNSNFKISFASSIGRELSSNFSLDKELFLKYRFITCREQSAVNTINEICHKNKADFVVDPTLIVPNSFWTSTEKEVKRLPKHYVLSYKLHPSKKYDEIIENLQKEGKTIISVSPSFNVLKQNGKKRLIFNPFEFLYLIHNADYIVTDSFHATCLSISYHKQFLSIAPGKTKLRITNLLELLGIKGVFFDSDCMEEVPSSILDYNQIESTLDRVRDESKTLILNKLKEIENCE